MVHEQEIFVREFLSVDPEDISRAISEEGYFAFPGAVAPEFLKVLRAEIDAVRPSVNHNGPTPVYFNEQYFFPHALGLCQSYFEYVTAAALRNICRSKFGVGFRLKCHRYYETGPGHSMEWHADNVTNQGVVTDVDGLIFILYVNDVFEGEFQLVSESFRERKEGEWTYNYTNAFIEETYKDKIRTFSLPAGSLIIYDTYGIHRAKPITSSSFIRKSIFFQVDKSDRNAELCLINPSFVIDREPALLDYLGFGKPVDFPANPPSSLKSMPFPLQARLQLKLARAMVTRLVYGLDKLLFSHDSRLLRRRKLMPKIQRNPSS